MTEAAEAISLHELCERFRRIYMPAVCDAMYHLGIEEQVLPSSLRPLHPEQRIVGEAFTLEGRDIVPRVGWDEGIERMRPYLEMQPRTSEFLFARGSVPIRDFRMSWNLACQAAGVPGLLFHDLRRTAFEICGAPE